MAEVNFKSIELVDRKDELRKLKEHLVKSIEGKGSTVFISGEAGIGKTRIVEELINQATDMGFKVIRGQCLPEHIEPFFPFKSALKKANMEYLLSNKPPPLVLSAYLISGSGLLINRAERKETNLDPDIFVGMLKAIEAFVKDSMHILGNDENATLNSLSYGDYNIIIRTQGDLSLATVIKGDPNEFLIEDMRLTLEKLAGMFTDWDGDEEQAEKAKPYLEWFIKSGKYDGTYLVGEPQIMRENIFDNILMGLQRVSESNPLIVFIDDLQWADQTSLNFIYYLARNIKKNRILLIGTYRPEEIIPTSSGKLHPLEITINNLAAERLLRIIGLRRLSREDTNIFISRILGDFDESVGDKVYMESNGNPLFIIEIIKLLIYEKAIYHDGIRWRLRKKAERIVIPKHAYDIIKRRLERLDDEEREILDVASVVGEEFNVTILSLVTGMDELKILKKLNNIYRKHKLIYETDGKYRFEHSIIREVLYNELLDELRRKYHKIIADVLYELNKDNIDQIKNILAHHYYEARDKKAVDFLIEAGDKARRNYANDEALNYYERVLEIADEYETRSYVFESMGDIVGDEGDFKMAEEKYREALKLARDDMVHARIYRKIAELYRRRGEYSTALDLLKNSEEITKGKHPLEEGRVYREMGLIKFMEGDYRDSLEYFKKALKLFAEINAKRDIGEILKDVASIHTVLGYYEKARKYYIKALQIMKDIGDMKEIATVLSDLGNIYFMTGDYDMALRIYESSLKVMKNVGYKWGVVLIMINIGNVHLKKCEFADALRYYEESKKISEKIGQKGIMTIVMNNIGEVLYNLGNMRGALKHYSNCLKMSREIGNKLSAAYSLLNISRVYLIEGKFRESLKILQKVRDMMIEIGDKKGYYDTLLALSECELKMGKIKDAEKHAKEALKIAQKLESEEDESMARIALGAVHREMGDHRRAVIEFTKALRYFAALNNKLGLATVYCELGKLWATWGDFGKAKEQAKRAIEIYRELNMKFWVQRCEEELSSLGVK